MSQLNRPDQETNIIANIFTNILNLISGNKMQAQLKNLNDSCPNILSDKDQANGYVGTSAANEMIAGYYRESIGKVAILNKAEAATLVANKGYLVTDATGDGTFIGVIAKDTVSLYPTAIDLENNTFGTYDINTWVFTAAASGGNANIVTLDTVALQALQSGSTLSQTTFYINTNAVSATRKLQIYAIANNTNVVAAIDMTTGEIGTYDITGDVFVATGVAWGNITGNIEDQTDVGARADTLSNIFIGAGNNSNSITTSNQNLFYQNADANTLLDSSFCQFGTNSQSNDLNTCTNIVIGVESNGNLMLNAESYKIGNCSSNCEIDGGSNNIIGDYCSVIKLDKTTNCVFGNFVINFDNTTFPSTSFTLCAIATGLDFTGVDFTAATQLFGRTFYWSINKILGTNLIEVTFDTGLTTAQTGQYDTSADTFTPYGGTYTPTLTPDGSICTAAALAADAIYSVSNGVMKLMIPIDCTFDFTSNGATIDYTLPFGSIASSGGNVTFNLNPNSPSLPISGYEKNGVIVVTTKDTAFNDDLTIYATITIKLA